MTFEDRLQRLRQRLSESRQPKLLSGMRRGIEKESLRVTRDGHLSQQPHPRALGSTLTHPCITTDYSEALLEFITPALDSIDSTLGYLEDIHTFTYQALEALDEQLWVHSMPCIVGSDEDIPIARYGSSNSGRMKYIYRVGLWHRYGRLMQAIAGIHYNFSLPESFWPCWQQVRNNSQPLREFVDAEYFALIRNFQRHAWLLVYLFGASPAVCASFLRGKPHQLHKADGHTLYLPEGTSLRMSDIGYQNNAQSDLFICYNSLPTYVDTLTRAIHTPAEAYRKIGVKVNGEYRQLNDSILQIENEFYSAIRPKRTTEPGERPTLALSRRGVEYIEVRCLDLDPFEPAGINATTAAFVEVFLFWCLITDSHTCDDAVYQENKSNLAAVVREGRHPGLALSLEQQPITLTDWAEALWPQLEAMASLMDQYSDQPLYRQAVDHLACRIREPENTPSAQILALLAEQQASFSELALQQAEQARRHFANRSLSPERQQWFEEQAILSLQKQQELETEDSESFEEYLAAYFA